MYQLNKQQKIILGVIIAIIVGFICYYVYAKEDRNQTNFALENNIETEEKEEKQEYSDSRILVHISGAVNKEGIVELKIDSRISDAIEKAGGVREDASMEDINLAYKLEDGMKIHIPTKEEKQKSENSNETYFTASSGSSTIEESIQSTQNAKDTKVNLNTATQTQLETLPGIGPSTANKILSYRKEKGRFKSIEDIKEVSGIGEAKFEKIKDLISVK